MNFRVGQKVVCVDDRNCGPRDIKRDGVYTVTAVGLTSYPSGNPAIKVDGFDVRYWTTRFRPAVEPSIECFTAALTKTRKENLRLAKRPVKEDA